MFSRLGAWCARRRGTVLIAWVLVLVLGGALSGAVGSGSVYSASTVLTSSTGAGSACRGAAG
jgi:hypothetical protein